MTWTHRHTFLVSELHYKSMLSVQWVDLSVSQNLTKKDENMGKIFIRTFGTFSCFFLFDTDLEKQSFC